jgi:small GTP-binding protein
MSLNDTPSANRVHIGFFGCRNAGKSSLVNAVTGQSLAVVSDVAGTTTDPVYKSMELLPLGPVVIIDTPGIDDTGELGELRVSKTRQVLAKIDVAVLVVTMEKYSFSLKTLFRVRNASNCIPQWGQVHPQRVSARSWSLFHECPHSVQMFVPSALLIA